MHLKRHLAFRIELGVYEFLLWGMGFDAMNYALL